MTDDLDDALMAIMHSAVPDPADITVMQRETGDICILVEWRHKHPAPPPLRICVLEDLVSTYKGSSITERNLANGRLYRYIREQFDAHDAYKHAVALGNTECVEWTILKQQIYNDQ